MSNLTVQCPECGASVSVTDALAAEAKENLREQMRDETRAAEAKARAEANEASRLEVSELKSRLGEQAKKVVEFQRHELDLRKRLNDIEAKEKSLQLDVQRTIDGERRKIEEDTARRIMDESRLKAAEKDCQLDAMRKQIDELKRKAEQGSQQAQGEVLELSIEQALKDLLPTDSVQPVPKGIRGADIIHAVYSSAGLAAGTILWEAKRTKSWKDVWVEKIKEHQREISAEHAVIVTQVLPKGIERSGFIDGVWVVDFATYQTVALALRYHIISLAQARSAAIGRGEKMGMIYDYLTGTEFRQHVEATVEVFVTMRQELDVEKRVMQKCWAGREKQIEKLTLSTAGLYGDVQGIVGRSLPQIALLEIE